MLFLSATGLLRWIVRVVPIPVVKGIQMGAGLSLILGAGSSLLKPLRWADPVLDNRIWAAFAFLVLICTQRFSRFPYALCFFMLSLVFAFVVVLTSSDHGLPRFHVWNPQFVLPKWVGASPGNSSALWMAIGQLPLTTLNSIIAVSQLSSELLPHLPAPSVTSTGFSVAVMNLTATWFGGMPVCHGAGGLAAQYRFGARSGASIIILGVFKILLGLIFGETLVDLLRHYPSSILGIMVFAAGLELVKVGNSVNDGAPDLWQAAAARQDGDSPSSAAAINRLTRRELFDEERMERWTVMLTTTGGILAFRNDAVGFLAGMLCHGAFKLSARLEQWQEKRSGFATEQTPLLR